jgi:hypothetical protein
MFFMRHDGSVEDWPQVRRCRIDGGEVLGLSESGVLIASFPRGEILLYSFDAEIVGRLSTVLRGPQDGVQPS